MSQAATASLFANNLPADITLRDLKEVFKDLNAMHISIASCGIEERGDQETCTGHIEFASEIEAETAFATLQNYQILAVSPPVLLKLSKRTEIPSTPPVVLKPPFRARLLSLTYKGISWSCHFILRLLCTLLKIIMMFVSAILFHALYTIVAWRALGLPLKNPPHFKRSTDTNSRDAAADSVESSPPIPPTPIEDEDPKETLNEIDALRSEIASLCERLEASSAAAESEKTAREILEATHLAQVKDQDLQFTNLQKQYVTLQDTLRCYKEAQTKASVKLEKDLAEKEQDFACAELTIEAMTAASDNLRREKAEMGEDLNRAREHARAADQTCVRLGQKNVELENALNTATTTIKDMSDDFARLRREKDEEIRNAEETLQKEIDWCKHDIEVANSRMMILGLEADCRVSVVERKMKDEKERNEYIVDQLNGELKAARHRLLQLEAQKKEAEQLHAKQLEAEKRGREKAEADKMLHEEMMKSANEEMKRKADKEREYERKTRAILVEEIRCRMKDWHVGWNKERAFARFKFLLGEFGEIKFSETQPLTIWSIPWPLLTCPTEFSDKPLEWKDVDQFFDFVKANKPEEHDKLLEKAIRIFHPDRWRSRNLLDTVMDANLRVYLEKSGTTITQALNPRPRLSRKF